MRPIRAVRFTKKETASCKRLEYTLRPDVHVVLAPGIQDSAAQNHPTLAHLTGHSTPEIAQTSRR